MAEKPLDMKLRRQELVRENGFAVWNAITTETRWEPERTALVLCDIWDAHWCRGAVERLNALTPRMNEVTAACRSRGVLIVHAPSDTLDFYRDTPVRSRTESVPPVDPPQDLDLPDPPLPVDASDEGADTGETETFSAWSRQHPDIVIDQERDLMSDSGAQIYACFKHYGIRNMLMMGVHTNMCILHRTFGIKQMVRWGVPVALVRDLTDTMYNPAMPPYVSHDEGTRLVVSFIEKHWCPTVHSSDILS